MGRTIGPQIGCMKGRLGGEGVGPHNGATERQARLAMTARQKSGKASTARPQGAARRQG